MEKKVFPRRIKERFHLSGALWAELRATSLTENELSLDTSTDDMKVSFQ